MSGINRTLLGMALVSMFALFLRVELTCAQDSPVEIHRDYDLLRLELSPEHRTQVEAALQQKDYKSAEKILVQEAELDPKSPRAAKLLEFSGGLFFLDAQYGNAVIAWKKAEAIAPLDERTRFTLAMAYIKVNRRSWARSELDKLSLAHPDDALYLYWLARIDYDDQKYSEAIARLQRIVALDPNMVRSHDLLGLCYDYTGHFDQALASFSRAVELNRLQAKPSPWPPLDMAVTQIELNQVANAEKGLQEAITYNPKLPQAQYQLGRVLDKEGKVEQAIHALKTSAALDAFYPDPHYLLGRMYQKIGKDDLAKAEILEFQRLKQAANSRSQRILPP
jgi:tetratricopeptide (TPR) repeat protein